MVLDGNITSECQDLPSRISARRGRLSTVSWYKHGNNRWAISNDEWSEEAGEFGWAITARVNESMEDILRMNHNHKRSTRMSKTRIVSLSWTNGEIRTETNQRVKGCLCHECDGVLRKSRIGMRNVERWRFGINGQQGKVKQQPRITHQTNRPFIDKSITIAYFHLSSRPSSCIRIVPRRLQRWHANPSLTTRCCL